MRSPKRSRRDADADVADRLTALAKRLWLEKKVLLTTAMCAIGTEARVWLRLGERGGWLHPFGNGKDNAVTSALRGELREYLRRLNHPTHEARKFALVLEDKIREEARPCDAAHVAVMRDAARSALCLDGGALKLCADRVELVRPIPPDWLVLPDEIMPAECPATVDELRGHGHTDLLRVIKTFAPRQWQLVVHVIIKTLRGDPWKRTLCICGPRDSVKSAILWILSIILGPRCPDKVDCFIASRNFHKKSDTDPQKRRVKVGDCVPHTPCSQSSLTLGVQASCAAAIFRAIDEMDDNARKVFYPAVKVGDCVLPALNHH